MWFCKENQAIGQGDGTGMIISTEPDNKMKYQEKIGNTHNELNHWKRNFSIYQKECQEKLLSMN